MNVRVLLSCLGLKVPVIVSERTDPSHHKLPLKKISEWLRLKLYPKASKLVVQTKVAAQYFPSDWQESISIIPNAVRKPSVKWINNSNEIKKIISVGRLSKEKNHKELIIAFSEWVKDYPSLVLNIYGEGPEKENLERLILNLGLSCCVKLCGTVNNVQEVLVSSDLFVFPSIYEGFPNALCEALAIGLPVVASDCSGNAEVIEHGIIGLLFRFNDRKSLTKCVLSLLNDKEKVETLSSNASKITDRLSPEVVYSLWDSIIFKSAFI
jgi:glycosyltransferase involved in cell wall biosynthesis